MLKGLCPGLRDKITALSLYEVIKNCNDTGEIGFCGGSDGGRRKGGNRVVRRHRETKKNEGKRSKDANSERDIDTKKEKKAQIIEKKWRGKKVAVCTCECAREYIQAIVS